MTETPAAGYSTDNLTWTVNIAFDTVTITQSKGAWNGIVRNYTSYELPNTGGRGAAVYVLTGFTLLALPFPTVIRRRRRRQDSK
jgi:LPXTG-motif cell wall-anchored protein